MKLFYSLIAATLALAGCGSSPVSQDSAAAGASVAACDRPSATACRAGTLFRCEGGAWNSTFKGC
jgi:hypothetical protein